MFVITLTMLDSVVAPEISVDHVTLIHFNSFKDKPDSSWIDDMSVENAQLKGSKTLILSKSIKPFEMLLVKPLSQCDGREYSL